MALQTRVGGRGGVERVTLLNARFQQTPFRSAPTCLGTNYLASVWDNFPSINIIVKGLTRMSPAAGFLQEMEGEATTDLFAH